MASPPCDNHADTPAAWMCAGCGSFLCDGCVRPHATSDHFRSCPRCGGMCEPLGQGRSGPLPGGRNFYSRLSQAVAYPFAGRGKYILLVGALTLFWGSWVMYLIRGAGPVLGLLAGVVQFFVLGYLAAYMFRVVGDSALGGTEPPSWPELTSAWDDVFLPALQFVVIVAISFGPLIAFRVLTALGQVDLPAGQAAAAQIGLVAAGAVYMPMAILSVAIHDTIGGLNPLVVLPAIFRVPKAYVVAWGMLVVAGLAISYAQAAAAVVPVIGPLLGHAISLYFLLCSMHVIGLIYFCHADRLGWLEDT